MLKKKNLIKLFKEKKIKKKEIIEPSKLDKFLINIKGENILIDEKTCSIYYEKIINQKLKIVRKDDPIYLLKSIKNKTEINNMIDAHIIDGFGKVKGETYFKRRRGFKQGVLANIIQNKFLGCAIAFRASLINRILPFPSYIPAHDMWIGLISEVYGRSFFIEEPLFSYRRHSANVSSMTHENLIKMLQWRIILIFQLFRRVIINLFH